MFMKCGMMEARILIVDSDEISALMHAKRIAKRGFIVDIVHSGNAALEFVESSAPDIVLLDLMLPDMNGMDILKEIRKKYGYYGDSIVGIEIGIALNIKTPNEDIYKFFELNDAGRSLIDFVQFMGIREIGYQGQYFDERVLGKIRELRQSHSDTIISVDGGVTFENAHEIVEAGVNRLVSGSAIYESENIKEAIEEMKII